ncbi:methyltransferase [Mycobacteriaceae bacterium 1482268.1]|nr:methyltransferase [Mycobacteriaceae bacterium 1482268.1]
MGFWPSRVVLLAVECGLFTELAAGPANASELMSRLGWHPRGTGAVLDCLVGLGLLKRDRTGRYANSLRANLFLDRNKPSYIGGLMELSSKRLYDLWADLDDLITTGNPVADEERGNNEFFSTLYQDPDALKQFLSGMTGISTAEATLIAARFPWKRFRTFVDVGGAQGAFATRVALTHSHLTGINYDLAGVGPIFKEYVASFGLDDRLTFAAGDMNEGPLPQADVISFGHLLHGYGESTRRHLINKAYAALPPGGSLLVYDAMVDKHGRYKFMSLLSSLNIMLETREGFEATTDQCAAWLRDAGFRDVTITHLVGPTSMVYGFKPSNDGPVT